MSSASVMAPSQILRRCPKGQRVAPIRKWKPTSRASLRKSCISLSALRTSLTTRPRQRAKSFKPCSGPTVLRLPKGEILRTEVKDREELGRKVRELQFELEKLKSEIGRNQRRVEVSLVVLLLLLGGIGAGIWRLPDVVKKEVGYDRGRAREQLVADIKAEAQKKIVEAGDDWRKTIEIEEWRDQQLSDLDRFLDRIQQTFDAGEATESYRKATDLLAAKGADEALAYLQARGNQRKSQIEMQANRRDQEEAGLRNLLQEELLAASLLETKFRFDDAEANYRQVLERSGSCPKARTDFTWS